MEWILVLILLGNFPDRIDTDHKGGYGSMIECFEDREIVIERLNISGPQAVCIQVKGQKS